MANLKPLPLLIVPDRKQSMYEIMFHLSNAYIQSAKLTKQQYSQSKNAAFILPAIVCQAFAIELLIKFFICLDYPEVCNKKDCDRLGLKLKPKDKPGHHFSALWDMVAPNWQDAVTKHFSLLFNTQSTRGHVKGMLNEIGDDSFTKWRDIYEDHNFNFMHDVSTEKIADVFFEAALNEMEHRNHITVNREEVSTLKSELNRAPVTNKGEIE